MKVKEMLSPGNNFEVLEAKDGVEGLNLILKEKLSLIMLDFILPKLSGWEVFQKIQSHPELRKIPLVIMSGRKEEVTEKIPEPFEYFDFLGKPFDKKQLMDAIRSATIKAKQPRPDAVSPTVPTAAKNGVATTPATNDLDAAAEIKLLNEKIAKMQAEIESLKKQLTQVVTFIKQKIK
ncbi:two-component response regulator [Richelia sinica FACHB-800]|uniref:Two-component response regulator n=1 Tax=Richelia sinica FACHB-800 TaxID=1357546 RepID=A0A975T695_9NOST|nr:two-component response regulator [Richelia sinica FACHB-800]